MSHSVRLHASWQLGLFRLKYGMMYEDHWDGGDLGCGFITGYLIGGIVAVSALS